MTNERNALKAGLFIVVTLGLIVGILVSIKGLSSFTEPRQELKAIFQLADNVGGLRVGDEVRIGGYKVGQVRDIRVEQTDDPNQAGAQVVVRFSLPKRYRVREDAQLAVETTVTGTSVLNFRGLGRGADLPPQRALPGQPSAFERISTTLAELGPRVQGVLDDVRKQTIPKVNAAVDKMGQTADAARQTADTLTQTGQKATGLVTSVQEKVDPIVARYEKFVDAGVKMMDAVAALFGDIKTDFRTTVANLREATGTINAKAPGLVEQMAAFLEKLTRTVDSLNETMIEVKAAVNNTKELTGGARSVVVSNRTKLDEMIDAFKKTGDNLKAASEEIRRSPWRLLYKPRPDEMANLNVFDAARQFAEGANDLNNAAGALRDALKDPNADKDQVRKLMQRVDESFGHFQQVETKLWQSVKE